MINSSPSWTTKRVPAGVSTIAAGLAQQAGQRLMQEWNIRRTWKLTISADDDLYPSVQAWLMSRQDTVNRRALVARTHYPHNDTPTPTIPELRFLIDGDTPQNITVDGHRVQVYVESSDRPADTNKVAPVSSDYFFRPPRLVFSTNTRTGREAVANLLRHLDTERARGKRTPGLMVLGRWGDWQRRSDLPARTMESVITTGGVLEELYADLRNFRDREPDYVRRGIPYHRAYLLTGPPGTGKTSAVKAVTNALSLDLWYAQLSGIDKDAKLIDVFGEVRAQGVLLLEDIDSLPAALTRDDNGQPVKTDISAAGLLNALDGVATPHGLVTIMTTNHIDRLDPALLRPGRIDRVISFVNPDSATIVRHFQFFYGRSPRTSYFPAIRSSAAVSELFKQHMDDPDAAEAALRAPISKTFQETMS